MNKYKTVFNYFSKPELLLWIFSALLIIISFVIFDRAGYLTLAASLTGITSILFNAKGNHAGQALMIVFSFLYGYISYTFSYYGEMITYLGMTMPMAVFALVAWLRHPYQGKKSEVAVNRINGKEIILMLFLAVCVTVVFFFILRKLNTANIYPSTLSVTTTFIAVYLTFRRSPYFSAAYAANDIVLIILWSLASIKSAKYIPVTVCFTAFLINDIYAFFSWKAMEKRQSSDFSVS